MSEAMPLVATALNVAVSIAALLTTAAAIVAARAVFNGINVWQRERERQTRHSAAVAVLKTTYRLDHAIASIRQLALIVEAVPEHRARKSSARRVADINAWLTELDLRWQQAGEAKAAYGAATAEARIAWPGTDHLYDPLLAIVDRLRASTLEYARFVKSPEYDPTPEVRKRIESDLHAADLDSNDELSERIKEAVAAIEGFVRSALSSTATGASSA